MYLKDIMGNPISDDAEFEDLEDFDYVEEFSSKYDDTSYDYENDDDYDDLDDLYVDDDDDFIDDEEDFDDFEDEDESNYSKSSFSDDEGDVFDSIDEEVEVEFICEDCGHKWLEIVPETDDENDTVDSSCPICGSRNVTGLN